VLINFIRSKENELFSIRLWGSIICRYLYDKEEQQLCVIINYEDGTSWRYKINQLYKITGPYSHEMLHKSKHKKGLNTKWWHYGEDKGGINIASLNPCPSRQTACVQCMHFENSTTVA